MVSSKINSSGLWNVTVAPSETVTLEPAADMRVTNVSFDHQIGQELTRTTLLLRYTPSGAKVDVCVALGSLLSPRIEQMCLDVIFPANHSYTLEVKGPNVLHVTGYFMEDEGEGEEIQQTKITRQTMRGIPKHPSTYDIIGPGSPSKPKGPPRKRKNVDSEEEDDEVDREGDDAAEDTPRKKKPKKEH